MKRIFTIVVLIASLVFTSCEDFLTEDVRGQLNVDTYYKSIEECESAVTSCYQAMTYGGWWQINTVWLLSEMCGDDAWTAIDHILIRPQNIRQQQLVAVPVDVQRLVY